MLLNGHGGNELKPLSRELHHRTGVFLCVCDWFRNQGVSDISAFSSVYEDVVFRLPVELRRAEISAA